ncbi:MAG TPA: hypothetical protein VHZ95_19340, partial [Polyangiales bacterium]|nr:hypothetical protein [Polyangiales bacterium]
MRARIHWAEWILLACLLGLIALAAGHPLYAVDFFWHLKLGEWIEQHRRIPHLDLFSAANPNRPYTQFNWLWEWSFARLTAHFGLRGVRAAQALILASSFGLFY